MKNRIGIFILVFFLLIAKLSISCTNFIVTKGASKDGSTMLFYTCDGQFLYHLKYYPVRDYKPGDSTEYRNWRTGISGKIKDARHTFATLGFQMNEYQVSIGETTFTGREELINKSKFLQYFDLMHIALQRAKTARQAVEVMTRIVDTYGYGSEGESFSITDPNQAWILEMIGTGNGGKGAVWVALKIPDGMVCAHANMSIIGEFPLDDPENCVYSKNVISFAIEKGYYDPGSGRPFRFNEVYNPINPNKLKYCETRVWRLFSKAAPSLNLSSDYCRGIRGAKRYPLWIKPDKKLSLKDVINIVRDHYEGTSFDMTKGLEAGPFGTPKRNSPLSWQLDSVKYSWERPISIYYASFSFIAQSRSWLPNPLGGIVWFGEDDNYTTCYVPLYCGINKIPQCFSNGDIKTFSWDCAWWVFNFVSNYANLKYSYMIKDIQKVQNELENKFIAHQDSVEKIAVNLYNNNNNEALTKFLTDYSLSQSKIVLKKWTKLSYNLISKYNDGFVKKNNSRYGKNVGYPDEWERKIIKAEPNKFKIPIRNDDNK